MINAYDVLNKFCLIKNEFKRVTISVKNLLYGIVLLKE